MTSRPRPTSPDSSGFMSGGGDFRPNDSFSPACLDRFSRFSIYMKNAIEKISSGVSEEQYVYLLGKLRVVKKSKSVPGKMQKRMKAGLMDSLLAEVEDVIVKEENIKANMQQLEKLVDQSMLEEGQEAWRPNGNVNDHMRSHLMEVKLKHKDELEQIVREKEQHIECVLGNVNRLRTHVRSLESRLHLLKSQSVDSSALDRIDKKVIDKVDCLD